MNISTGISNEDMKLKLTQFVAHLKGLVGMAEEIIQLMGNTEDSLSLKTLSEPMETSTNELSRIVSPTESTASLGKETSIEKPEICMERGEDEKSTTYSRSNSTVNDQEVDKTSFATIGSPSIDAMINMAALAKSQLADSVISAIAQYISNSSNLSLVQILDVSTHLQRTKSIGGGFRKTNNVYLWASASKSNLEVFCSYSSSSASLIPLVLYDRAAPAVTQLRLKETPVVLLLCLANYDKARKGRYGIDHWIKQETLRGSEFDCIHGTGSLIPNHKEGGNLLGSLIPFGKTVQNTQFPSYDLPYNEFIFYDPQQVSLQYIVVVK